MSRFLPRKTQWLKSFLSSVTDLTGEGLRFLGFLLGSRTTSSATILFLLERILKGCVSHYNQGRPPLSLGPGIPEPVAAFIPRQGHERQSLPPDCSVVSRSILCGPHQEYR